MSRGRSSSPGEGPTRQGGRTPAGHQHRLSSHESHRETPLPRPAHSSHDCRHAALKFLVRRTVSSYMPVVCEAPGFRGHWLHSDRELMLTWDQTPKQRRDRAKSSWFFQGALVQPRPGALRGAAPTPYPPPGPFPAGADAWDGNRSNSPLNRQVSGGQCCLRGLSSIQGQEGRKGWNRGPSCISQEASNAET